MWSDGSGSQYKGKHSFYYLDKFEVPIERNFFGSEHGKGESDAMTGLISRHVSDAIKSRKYVIHNAQEMRDFLDKKFDGKDENAKYEFKIITEDDMKPIHQQFDNVKVGVLEGSCTRQLHQIKASSQKGMLLMRPFSCFCKYCLLSDFE